MVEALLLVFLVNAGLWLLLWVMSGLEPPHPTPAQPVVRRSAAVGGRDAGHPVPR